MPNDEELRDDLFDERLAIVYKLLCRGLNRATILAYVAEMKWELTPDHVDALIDAATAELAKAAIVDVDAELGKSLERLNHLYMEAVKVHDFKTALSIQKEINKILQLKVAADANRAPGNARGTEEKSPRHGLRIVAK